MMDNFLFEQNLHWQHKRYAAGTERELLSRLMALMDIDQVLAISGVRRCGKSYLMKQMINRLLDNGVAAQNILFMNLELPALVGKPAAEVLDDAWNSYLKIKDPQGRVFLLLDEIQTLPGWETWIKYHYDVRKGEIKFIITGSNSQLLSSEFATRLSGRVIEKRLFPFSLRERLVHAGIDYSDPQTRVLQKNRILAIFENMLYQGSMPEIIDIEEREIKREILAAYFDTIVYKDIVPRFSVRQSRLLKDLAVYLTGQAGSLVNLKKLAELFGSNRNIMKEFLSYLDYALLVSLLEKFDYSARKRELSFKKIYLIDNGFAAFIPLRFSPDRGHLFENQIAIELLRRDAKVFYWKNQGECDFIVLEKDEPALAIQACFELNENNRDREVAAISGARRHLGVQQAVILTFNQTDTIAADDLTIAIRPAYQWLIE